MTGPNIKLKTEKKKFFCISASMPAEYWYVPRVSCLCKNSIPLVVCSFWHGEDCGVAFLCCWVPLPSFPLPIQNNFVTVGCSRVCVGHLLARLCFNCVYWACSSVFTWASTATWRLLYFFVLWCGVRDRVGTAAVLFLSRKVAAGLSEWVCCRSWSNEAE